MKLLKKNLNDFNFLCFNNNWSMYSPALLGFKINKKVSKYLFIVNRFEFDGFFSKKQLKNDFEKYKQNVLILKNYEINKF